MDESVFTQFAPFSAFGGLRTYKNRTGATVPTEFAILGAGAWGTAVSLVLAQDPEHRVKLWSARPETAVLLHQKRENVRLLPGVPIPPAVLLTSDIGEAVARADLLVTAIPTVHLRPTLVRIGPALPAGRPVLSL